MLGILAVLCLYGLFSPRVFSMGNDFVFGYVLPELCCLLSGCSLQFVYTNRVLRLIEKMIYAYFVVMLVQQAYSLLGGGRNLWLNYTGVENKPNMLALEVSHAARTLSAFLLCILDYSK